MWYNICKKDLTREILKKSSTSVRDAYAKYPMGNDGFVATSNAREAIAVIEKHGLKAKVVARLVKADETGVELTAFNGEKVYFSGKD